MGECKEVEGFGCCNHRSVMSTAASACSRVAKTSHLPRNNGV